MKVISTPLLYLFSLLGLLMALSTAAVVAQKKTDADKQLINLLPPSKPKSPADARDSYEIDGDYKLELVAAEPLIVDPVDLAFDARGRLFVAELQDYPMPTEKNPLRCRIRLLTDTDGDGTMDKAVTWAENFEHLNGILPMNGGLLVTTHVDTFFLKDSDGDNVADVRELLFRSNKPIHSQHFVTNPHWGLDNLVNLNNGTHGKEIFIPEKPDSRLNIERRNIRFNPRTRKYKKVSGHGQFGAAIDDWGHRFFCTNRNPVIFEAIPLVAMERNQYFNISTGNDDIAASGGDAKVYPLTLTHTTAPAHAGTFTAACGTFIYRGDLMPELKGNAFACEPTGQLVVRFLMGQKGASLSAERVGERRDFLASDDAWSRPVNLRSGPSLNTSP